MITLGTCMMSHRLGPTEINKCATLSAEGEDWCRLPTYQTRGWHIAVYAYLLCQRLRIGRPVHERWFLFITTSLADPTVPGGAKFAFRRSAVVVASFLESHTRKSRCSSIQSIRPEGSHFPRAPPHDQGVMKLLGASSSHFPSIIFPWFFR